MYQRRNGQFVLQITGHPDFGVPFGQDRIVPILLATPAVQQKSPIVRFRSAGEMLEVFGMHKGGKEYRRLVSGFERIFGATIFFGTDQIRASAKLVQRSRFNFLREAQIWYNRQPNQPVLSDEFENVIVLSDEFYEVSEHSIPTDLSASPVARMPGQDLAGWKDTARSTSFGAHREECLMASPSFAPQSSPAGRMPLARIDAVVSARLGPTRGLGNSQPACFNRQIAMYLAARIGRWSTTIIGRFYGGRDHSTVCHALQRIEALRETDTDLDALLADLRRRLREDDDLSGPLPTPIPLKMSRLGLSDTDLDRVANVIAESVYALVEAKLRASTTDGTLGALSITDEHV